MILGAAEVIVASILGSQIGGTVGLSDPPPQKWFHHVHFTPTFGLSLNLVDRWFATESRKILRLPYVCMCMGNPKGVKRDFEALEKRGFEAMRLLNRGLNRTETARRLKVARQTVSQWTLQYRELGQAGLRQAGRAGRKPLLDAAQLERLEALLLKGPVAHGFPTPLWSCPRVARLIERHFGVRYHDGYVWKILRALHWSPQRPVGKARERNEEAILKKKPKNKAARSSSATKAD